MRATDPSGSGEPEPLGNEPVSRFIEAVSPAFQATRRRDDDLYPLSPDGVLPRRITAWSFVARDPTPAVSGVRLRFSLRVFEFGSAAEATDAITGLAITAETSVLLKSPLLAVRLGSSVLRLDGACTFSRERWAAIRGALIRALPPGDEATAPGVLEIWCGGSVLRRPGPGRPAARDSATPGGGGRHDSADRGVEN